MRVITCLALGLLFTHVNVAHADTPLGIAGLFDLSSPGGVVWGTDERDGFLLAIEDFKKENPGTSVRYAIEDSAYSNTKSLTGLRKLLNVDNFDFVVGPTWETFAATAPVCESERAVCLAPSHNGVTFSDPQNPVRYSFTAFYDESGYGARLAEEMVRDKKTRILGITAITEYYEILSAAFLKHAPRPPALFERFAPDTTDFRSVVTRAPRDIDSIYLTLDANGQNFQFLSQWSKQRTSRPTVYSHDGILYEPQWKDILKLGFTMKVSKPYVEPQFESAWKDKFAARYSREPSTPSGAIAYDETRLLLACMKRHNNEVDPVRNCIASTANYKGMSGLIDFNGKQAVASRSYTIETFLPAER